MDSVDNSKVTTPQLQAELEALRTEVLTLRQNVAECQTREAQLKKELSRFQYILEKAASAITVQSPNADLIYANQAAATMLGYSSAKELLDTPLPQVMQRYQVLDAEERLFPVERFPGRRVIKGEYDPPPEEIMRFRIYESGVEYWSIVRATPVLNEQQELQFVINVFQDITGLKQAEAALRVQQEWFQVTLSSIGDAVIATDVEGRVTFMNKVAQALTGWTLDQARNHPLEEVFRIVNEYTRQTVENPVTKVLRQGTVVGLANHTVLLARDGREIPIDDSAAPIRGEDEKINGVVLVFRDVTERKEAEDKERFLAEASQLLTSSLDYQTTLNNLARLTLPRLADYCLIDLFEETEIQETAEKGQKQTGLEDRESAKSGDGDNRILRRVVVAHVDPVKEKLMQEKEIYFLPDLDSNYGIGKVLKHGEPEFIPNIGEADLQKAARNQEHLDLLGQLTPCSAISVPMLHQGRVLGALSLFFTTTESGRIYNRDGLNFVAELAQRAALAVENARLYHQEQVLKSRQAYLAQAGEVLSSSLDYELTLQRVAESAVPLLADWCTVHVLGEEVDQASGIPRQVGLAHWNPAKIEWAKQIQQEMEQRYPYDPEAGSGLPKVLKTGEAELYPDIPDELLVAAAVDEYQLQLMRDIGYSSVMIVPMIARERVLGAIQLVATSESGKHYTQADLAFARELARRAALAVDNARLYREAQRAIATQNEVNRLKDQFLSIASHELRTPLTSIKGFTQLLQRQTALQLVGVENNNSANPPANNSTVQTQLPPTTTAVSDGRGLTQGSPVTQPDIPNIRIGEVNTVVQPIPKLVADQERTRRVLSNITLQVDRMDKLIGEMLDISRIQSGKLELKLTAALNLTELLQRIIEQHQVANPQRTIQLETPIQNISGNFDEARLEQVLNNLIANALKYSPRHKPVLLGLKMENSASNSPALNGEVAQITDTSNAALEGRQVVIWVKDEGYGISEEDQAHLFESFYRARTQENQGIDGLGLGLYISQQIIQRHNGRIWLESKPGQGSTFYFALPLK
jgi:PAS domain S-box-containing protein